MHWRFALPDRGGAMLSDGQWALLEPLIEACRPKGKTPPQDLRRTLSAILWRHQNGAKWRSIPDELGPWWRAAQIFIRWGRAIAFRIAPGQAHELPHAIPLLERLPGVPKWVVGDRGYTSHRFREHIWNMGARPAIPPQRHEAPVACPEWIYTNRNQGERLWARLKEWRAVATRYEKTATSFMGVLCLAATLDHLKRGQALVALFAYG